MARIDDYRESFRLASERIAKSDLVRLALNSGAEASFSEGGSGSIKLSFLGMPVEVVVDGEVDVRRSDGEGDLSLPEKILVVHYLLGSTGKPATGEYINFRQVPDGRFYFDAFQRRARDPFLATFGRSADLFRRCAGMLGGNLVDGGDVGMEFCVFPHVRVRLILWEGDDEFPPEAGVLFDAGIRENLPAEDIAVLSGMLVYKLMGIARGLQNVA